MKFIEISYLGLLDSTSPASSWSSSLWTVSTPSRAPSPTWPTPGQPGRCWSLPTSLLPSVLFLRSLIFSWHEWFRKRKKYFYIFLLKSSPRYSNWDPFLVCFPKHLLGLTTIHFYFISRFDLIFLERCLCFNWRIILWLEITGSAPPLDTSHLNKWYTRFLLEKQIWMNEIFIRNFSTSSLCLWWPGCCLLLSWSLVTLSSSSSFSEGFVSES